LTKVFFGDVWERAELSKRDRSLVTCEPSALQTDATRYLVFGGDPDWNPREFIRADRTQRE
jgi:hypothetical protein